MKLILTLMSIIFFLKYASAFSSKSPFAPVGITNSTDNFRYFVTKKSSDSSFFVLENTDSTNWIEWLVKKEPILGNRLYPSGMYSWQTVEDTGNGTVTLYDESREYVSRISNKGWFRQSQENSDFKLYKEGSWSKFQPIEIANATRTFEVCQRGVNNCADGGDQVGCCGPNANRCCNYNTKKCVFC